MLMLVMSVFITACGGRVTNSISGGGGSNTGGGGGNNNGGGGLLDFWTKPLDLYDTVSIAEGYGSDEYSVAMDRNGNAIIVWSQIEFSTHHIYKSEYRGGVWTHPSGFTDHIDPEEGVALAPSVAMDNNGNAIITWVQWDGTAYQIFKSEYRNGIWTHPAGLQDNISLDGITTGYPAVAMSDNGDAVIVWSQRQSNEPLTTQIYKSEFRNGVWMHPAGFQDHISLDGLPTSDCRVAMDGSGNTIVAWQQDGHIFISEYRGGIWTHPAGPTDYISPDGGEAEKPQIAMSNNGDAIIVWDESNPAEYNTHSFKSEYRGGAWKHPNDINDHIHQAGKWSSGAQAAMNDRGEAIIAYLGNDSNDDRMVFKSEYRNERWWEPSNLDDYLSLDTIYPFTPQVAMNNQGYAVITWSQPDLTNWYQIFKSELRNGVWTTPSNIDDNLSPDGTSAKGPLAVVSDNNHALIIWLQSDRSRDCLYKAQYPR